MTSKIQNIKIRCVLNDGRSSIVVSGVLCRSLKLNKNLNGALDRSRTCDLPIRNRLLYPTELPVRISLNFKKSIDSKGFNGSDL